MKSITIISGKGGTGKTTLTAGFAAIGESIVLADCDVGAADLHLLLQPEIKSERHFEGGKLAYIDPEKCTECGKCVEECRFDAISDEFIVSPIDCEGCNVCAYVCPVDAITLSIRESGKWFISDTRFGPMVHARLAAGQGNSGRLVGKTPAPPPSYVRSVLEQRASRALFLALPGYSSEAQPHI